ARPRRGLRGGRPAAARDALAMTSAGVVAFLLLLAHALSTHGPWFALIWLGLTSAIGAAVATGAPDVPSALRFGAVLYLAGLLAKGFVERTPHRGSIPLFVAAHALFSGWLALPIELSRSAE